MTLIVIAIALINGYVMGVTVAKLVIAKRFTSRIASWSSSTRVTDAGYDALWSIDPQAYKKLETP